MNKTKFWLLSIIIITLSQSVNGKEISDLEGYFSIFYGEKGGTSYNSWIVYGSEEDAKNRNYKYRGTRDKITLLWLGKGYVKFSRSQFTVKGYQTFQQYKILSYPSNRSAEGEIVYFEDDTHYGWSSKYSQMLNDVYETAKVKKSLSVLSKLKNDFSHHEISKKASITFDEIYSENLKHEAIVRNEKLAILSELKKAYEKSYNSIESMLSFSTEWSSNAIFLRNKFDDANPIHYRDGISEKQYNKLVKEIFNTHKKNNNILSLQKFIQLFPKSDLVASAESGIYALVSQENNISGYSWFLENYPSSKQAKKALTNMHKLAFELAEDIDTINAYNDFVIAYPTAKQVREANDRAYELEKSEYKSMLSYFSEEKDARRLLVQSKMLEQSAEGLSSDAKVGYMMVVNRMNDLLKQEFNSTDAALRHLESNEFKSFVRAFKSSMSDLKRQVSRIADNTADLSTIMKNQSSMMNSHFENAAQDREMASELTKKHRHWERFIGEVGL